MHLSEVLAVAAITRQRTSVTTSAARCAARIRSVCLHVHTRAPPIQDLQRSSRVYTAEDGVWDVPKVRELFDTFQTQAEHGLLFLHHVEELQFLRSNQSPLPYRVPQPRPWAEVAPIISSTPNRMSVVHLPLFSCCGGVLAPAHPRVPFDRWRMHVPSPLPE